MLTDDSKIVDHMTRQGLTWLWREWSFAWTVGSTTQHPGCSSRSAFPALPGCWFLCSSGILACSSFRADRKIFFRLLNLTCVLGDFGIIAMFSLEVIVHFHKIKTAIPQSLFSRTIDDVSGNNIQRRYPKYIWNRFSSSLKRGKFKWAKSKGKRKLWQFEQIQVKRLTNDRSVTSGN